MPKTSENSNNFSSKPNVQESAPEPAKVEQKAPVTDNITDEVYITNTGSKYHRSGCRHLAKSKIPISKSKAQAQGYEPCKNCKP